MLSNETIQMLAMQQAALKNPKLYDSMKATTYSQPTGTAMQGFQAYQLLSLITTIPVETPLLDEIPRSGGGFSNTANWKVRNNLNSRRIGAGVPEGSRNQSVAVRLYEYSAAFKTLYMEGSATLQARLAGQTFVDVDALATQDALMSHKVENEKVILFGNTTSTGIAFGKVLNVAVTVNSTTAGSIATAGAFVRVVALTGDGLSQVTAYGIGDNVADDVGAVRTVHPTFGDAFTKNLGAGTPSDEATVGSMTGATNQVKVTFDPLPGAVAYAVYVGATTGGSVKFLGVIYTNSCLINSFSTTTQVATSITGDRSQDQYVYDGIITQIVRNDPNTGATAGYVKSLKGLPLTASGKGRIGEVDEFLIDRKKKFKVSRFDIWIGPDLTTVFTDKVISGSTSTPYMVSIASGDVNLVGGQKVTAYNHPVTGEKLNVRYHPDLPPGIIMFKIIAAGLPAEYYRGNNVPAPWRIQEWLSYTSIVWPENTFRRDVGVATAEVLQGFTPFANGIISEIALSSDPVVLG